MDLNDLRNMTRGVKAPTGEGAGPRGKEESMENLMSMLQAMDVEEGKRFKRVMAVFGVLSLVYGSIFLLTWILPPDGPALMSRLTIALFTLIFLGIGLVARRRWQELSAKDYGKPSTRYLEREERRYRFIDTGELVFLIPFLAVLTIASGLGWMNAASRYLPNLAPAIAIAMFCLIWISALIIGFHYRKKVWQKTKASIWEALTNLRRDLTKEETSVIGE